MIKAQKTFNSFDRNNFTETLRNFDLSHSLIIIIIQIEQQTSRPFINVLLTYLLT